MPMPFKRKNTMDLVEARPGAGGRPAGPVDVRENNERARGFAPGSRQLPPGGMSGCERQGLDMSIRGRTR